MSERVVLEARDLAVVDVVHTSECLDDVLTDLPPCIEEEDHPLPGEQQWLPFGIDNHGSTPIWRRFQVAALPNDNR
jgi:hypothetical protein